jgi:hypothetical protein
MVTSNAIQRTFRLKYGTSIGSCFTIDIDGRQYLITAKHVLRGIKTEDNAEIYFEGAWHRVDTRLVGECPGLIDITAVSLGFQLSPSHRLPASDKDAIFGQDVYFLGFPFGLGAEIGEVNRNFPVPSIKKATLSAIVNDPSGARILYLDGNNNPGFSGGPVVFTPPPRLDDFRVAAVVSGYRIDPQPVFIGDQPTQLIAKHNTGIIISFAISHAVEVIRANPIGFELPQSQGNA